MKVVVIHSLTGTTKTAVLSAGYVSCQMADGGVYVTLHDQPGAAVVGHAMFTRGGIVALGGTAIDQYTPLSRPQETPDA